ncbi:MAG: hypothetical protein ACR2GN_00535 [Bacteroidia bacterium]
MRYYYEIWADAIEAAEKSESYMTLKDKMFVLLIGFSLAQGLNLALFILIISIFVKTNFFLNLNIFPGTYLDNALSGFITLLLPFLLLNYILIFYKKKHIKYKNCRKINTKGRFSFAYVLISISVYVLYLLMGKLFFG